MNLLNLVQSSPLIQWAILLLSASSAVLSLTLAVKTLILPQFSTLTKSQKASLTSFLQMLSSCSTSTIPNLFEALNQVLLKKGLLISSSQSPDLKDQSPELKDQSPDLKDQSPELKDQKVDALENFIEFIKAFKEDSK